MLHRFWIDLNLSAELWLHAVEHFRQTPSGQSRYAGLKIQRYGKPALQSAFACNG
jgi:hypothetical protein